MAEHPRIRVVSLLERSWLKNHLERMGPAMLDSHDSLPRTPSMLSPWKLPIKVLKNPTVQLSQADRDTPQVTSGFCGHGTPGYLGGDGTRVVWPQQTAVLTLRAAGVSGPEPNLHRTEGSWILKGVSLRSRTVGPSSTALGSPWISFSFGRD